MVEQLGSTQRTQQKALENLNRVVQLCNQTVVKPPKSTLASIREKDKRKESADDLPERQTVMIT